MEETVVLCGANSYLQKYYFNPDFDSLPQEVKQELQIMCVLYTEDVGGILTLEFEEDGSLAALKALFLPDFVSAFFRTSLSTCSIIGKWLKLLCATPAYLHRAASLLTLF